MDGIGDEDVSFFHLKKCWQSCCWIKFSRHSDSENGIPESLKSSGFLGAVLRVVLARIQKHTLTSCVCVCFIFLGSYTVLGSLLLLGFFGIHSELVDLSLLDLRPWSALVLHASPHVNQKWTWRLRCLQPFHRKRCRKNRAISNKWRLW